MPRWTLLSLLLLLWAVTPNVLTAQLAESTKNDLRTTTNAIVVLAGDDSLLAGRYRFKNVDSPDVKLDLLKFTAELPLEDDDGNFVPLIELSPALLDLRQEFNDTAVLGRATADSWSFGAGVGLRMQFFDKLLEITPRLKVDYSRVNYDFFIEGEDSDILGQIIPDIRAWSYIPSVQGILRQKLADDGAVGLFRTQASYVYVNASASGSSLGDFTDDSWVWKNSLVYEQPFRLGSSESDIIVSPKIGRVDFRGAARNGFSFNNFYEVGVDVLSRSVATQYLKEVGFGITYAYEDEFQGWRFGFFGELA